MSKIVLCVDDSATMQMVADITFRGSEFTYVGARTYEEGLEKAKGQKPAVVLVDSTIGNNGKSGYDLCLALKSEGKTQDVPVVLLIGNSAPYDAGKGGQVGADANLPKPWDTQTMLEKVAEIISKGATAQPGAAAAVAATPAVKTAPVSAKPAAPENQPPRSATIMGMPTIKMPGPEGRAAAVPGSPAVNKTMMMSAQMVAPANGGAVAAPAMRGPAPVATPAPAPAATATAAAASFPVSQSTSQNLGGSMNRSPMVSGTPTKRSALVERTLAKMAARLAEQSGLEPGSPELLALLKLSTEVVERIVWEVVPELAEAIIRENLQDLTSRRTS
ncbi:MAG: response regulator [Deltaproteobacteria bacterium]|nr:response regulator [Deltaproteobacteria bacterium]